MKKLAIVGASHFVNRMFEACGNYQWTREFFKNAEEAGATKVEFGIEWQAVEKEGVYATAQLPSGKYQLTVATATAIYADIVAIDEPI